MKAEQIQALMAGLVVLAAIVAGTVLILSGHDTYIGIGLIVIVAGYLGIDLVPWIPLGRNQKRKPPPG